MEDFVKKIRRLTKQMKALKEDFEHLTEQVARHEFAVATLCNHTGCFDEPEEDDDSSSDFELTGTV
jgi:hypothetical protein